MADLSDYSHLIDRAEIHDLDAILAVEPDSARDRVLRMATAYRLGRRETALADATWLLEQQPDSVDLDQVRRLIDSLEHDDR